MTSCTDSASPSPGARFSLWRHRNFRRYLTGQAASVAGSSISAMVVPVLAVIELDATTGEVAWLTFLGQLPPAMLALHAGALADRHSKRRQMIIGDLVGAAAVVTVPVAAALGTLTLSQLMVVAVVQGAASVLHDAAAISLLPSLVDRSLIQRSNSRIGALFAVAATGGSNLGAGLTALLGPARALLGDVGSYLISAWCTARIKAPESARAPADERRLHTEIGEGMRYVYRDHRLRTLTLVNATTSFGLALLNTLWALYLLRALSMSATAFGVVLGLGTLGAAAGALSAPKLARRYGPGPMMLTALAITPLTQIPLLVSSPGLVWQAAIGAALFLQLACAGAAGTTQRSIRQVVTAAHIQARMQAVSTWLTAGSRPVAALLAGGLGTWIGVRPTLIGGTCLLVVPFVVLYCSPLRSLRQMPDSPPAPSYPGEVLVQRPVSSQPTGPTVPGPAPTREIRHDRPVDGGAR
ncbi:MFS transporter [Streptomyces sp. NBC_01142]|uniref:MFS transporter n=1 Tax=Streptomyces sp. NBC_01142 TaxID=2975865 RepID=UPI00224F8A56|nr:MFS transporter [Streptomyces sp. NBC_01142]MCX4825782.1 MFS transporter [Streptomyces sp. NBC_01142]